MAKRRKRTPLLRGALALWAVALAGGLAITIWHVAGWLAATAVIAGAAYALGRRTGKAPGRSASPVSTGRQTSGRATACPPASGASPAVSGPSVPAIQSEVIGGLRGLGWTATAARSATADAVTAVLSDPGRTLTTETVLRTALASANRSQAIRPGGGAPGL